MTDISLLDDFYTEDELAKELHVCLTTLRNWRRGKSGPPITKLSPKTPVLYSRRSVQNWLASKEISSTAA